MRTVALRIAAVLWVLWGAVHLFAGIMTVTLGAPDALAGIADGVDPAELAMTYPPAVDAILNQHGWNLGWIGLTTLVCVPFVWLGRREAVVLAALVGGLADVGYFLFLDLGGFVNFVPGTIMTMVSGSAIVLSFLAIFLPVRAET